MMSVMIVNLPLETVNFHTLLSCRWKGQLNRKVQKICNLQNTNVFFARVKQFEKTEHCIFVGKNRHSRAYKWKSYLMEPDNYSRNTKTSHSHRILTSISYSSRAKSWFHLRWWNIMKYLNILWFSLNHSKGVHLIVSNNLIPFPWGPAVQIFFEPTWPWWWRSFWRYDIGAAIARLKPPFGAKSSEGWI